MPKAATEDGVTGVNNRQCSQRLVRRLTDVSGIGWIAPNAISPHRSFVEYFLQPFTLEETKQMLTTLGTLSRVEFEDAAIQAIQSECGGHPFLARQVAAVLNDVAVNSSGGGRITFTDIQEAIDTLIDVSGTIDEQYFKGGLWNDLENRDPLSIRVLTTLAQIQSGLSQEILAERVRTTQAELITSIRWLVAVGLVSETKAEGARVFSLRVPLLRRWLKRRRDLMRWDG
jgi:hypothetical protein